MFKIPEPRRVDLPHAVIDGLETAVEAKGEEHGDEITDGGAEAREEGVVRVGNGRENVNRGSNRR